MFNLSTALVWTAQCQVAWKGNSTNFQTRSTVPGHDVVHGVYDTCQMRTQYGAVLGNGSTCVATLIEYMLKAMAGTAQGVSIADASSGFGNVQEFTSPSTRQRSSSGQAHLLQRINGALHNDLHAYGILVTGIMRSDVHYDDGIATRMNVVGTSGPLSIHTNGTHATASFASLATFNRTKRDFLPTEFEYFLFDGVDGVKVTAYEMNGTLTGSYVEDLQNFAQDFVGKGPSQGPVGSTFAASDSWIYQVCNSTENTSIFYGKIIAEQLPADSSYLTYEDLDPFTCSTDGYRVQSADNSSTPRL